jgi:hypothetical protein
MLVSLYQMFLETSEAGNIQEISWTDGNFQRRELVLQIALMRPTCVATRSTYLPRIMLKYPQESGKMSYLSWNSDMLRAGLPRNSVSIHCS